MSDPTPTEIAQRDYIQQLEARIALLRQEIEDFRTRDTDRPPPHSLPPDEDTSPGSEKSPVGWLIQKQKGMMDALVDIKTRMDSTTPPPWAEKYFSEQVNLALRLEATEQAQKRTDERLSRLACWKSTEPPPCPILDVIDGGKAGE